MFVYMCIDVAGITRDFRCGNVYVVMLVCMYSA